MKTLSDCERKYYYQYYGYHNGWLKESDEETQKIYRLKNLKAIDALFGEIFHSTVKEALQYKNKEVVTPENFRRIINHRIKEAYLQSKECPHYWNQSPKKFYMINEVYYNQDISKEKKDAIINKINLCSSNIFKSDSFQELFEGKVDILELDELRSFKINGIDAFIKIDSLFKREDGKFVVVDWKTSSSDRSIEEINQLLIYGLYIAKIYGIKSGDIEFRLEYITKNESDTLSFNNEDLERVEQRISRDITTIKSYLEGVEVNKPYPIVKFQKTQRKNLCKYCNFKEACNEKSI